ncbi:hypothetical protein [Anaeromicropila populeti]|nr:hypothetical protein [Anaeromicropila populeti]
MAVDSLSSLFCFNETVTQIIYLVSPALTMNALSGYSEIKQVVCALLLLAFYLTVNVILGLYVFQRQDELNYGE